MIASSSIQQGDVHRQNKRSECTYFATFFSKAGMLAEAFSNVAFISSNLFVSRAINSSAALCLACIAKQRGYHEKCCSNRKNCTKCFTQNQRNRTLSILTLVFFSCSRALISRCSASEKAFFAAATTSAIAFATFWLSSNSF